MSEIQGRSEKVSSKDSKSQDSASIIGETGERSELQKCQQSGHESLARCGNLQIWMQTEI